MRGIVINWQRVETTVANRATTGSVLVREDRAGPQRGTPPGPCLVRALVGQAVPMTDDELETLTSEVYREGTAAGLRHLRSAMVEYRVDPGSARSLAVWASAHMIAYKLGQDVDDLTSAVVDFE